jgi:hypothetical protein
VKEEPPSIPLPPSTRSSRPSAVVKRASSRAR